MSDLGAPGMQDSGTQTIRETPKLRTLRNKVSRVEHQLERALTMSSEFERTGGREPLLSFGSSGRQLLTADESILQDGSTFVDTLKSTMSVGSIQVPTSLKDVPAAPNVASKAGEVIIKDLEHQMTIVEGAMKASRPVYGDYTEDKDTWSGLERRIRSPPKPHPFTPTSRGPRKAKAPKLAGGPRPCLTEPVPEAPPNMFGQFTSLGKMAESTKHSAMAPAFGTLTREDRKHVYINEAACISQPRAREGPAPGTYKLPSALLEQPESTKRSAPTPKFTTLNRPTFRMMHSEAGGRAHVTAVGRNTLEGDASVHWYTTVKPDDPLLGGQLSSLGDAPWRAAAPAFSIGGNTQRSKVVPTYTYTSPGPVYKLPSTLGKAPTAAVYRKARTPKPKRHYPPQYFDPRSSMGKQAASRSRSNPSFGFSKSERKSFF